MPFTDVRAASFLALKYALKAELRGMKRSRGQTAYSIIKERFKLRGSKQKVYDQFSEYLEKEFGLKEKTDVKTSIPD